MKVKRTAWHYKISNLGTGFERSSDNLCRYFWRLITKSLTIIISIPLAILAIGFAIYSVVSDPPALIVFLFFISSAMFPGLAVWFMRKKLGKSPEMPYGNIVTEYIKAKKEKVCPLIVYIEDIK